MTALELLTRLRALGVEVRRDGDRLHVRAPKGALTPELRRDFGTHRAEILALLRQAEAAPVADHIARCSRDAVLPLSFAQQRLWFLDRLRPDETEYNLAVKWHAPRDLDHDALCRALNEIIARHEILRTTFPSRDGVPRQVVHAPTPVDLTVYDLTHLPPAEARGEADRRVLRDVWRPFDLSKGPLLRFHLMRISDREHQLGIVLHHILFDDWSENLLLDELSTLYETSRLGRPSPLEALPIQYADYAAWQRDRISGDYLEQQLTYWRTQLADLPPLRLPADRLRPAHRDPVGALHQFIVPAETADRLREISRRAGGSMFMTLLAAFQAMLARYSGQDDFAVGTPIAGRTHPDTERLIGFFVNTLVLRADLSGDPSFTELLARGRKTVLGAFAHQDLPFDHLVEALRPERNPARTPFFDVLFTYAVDDEGPAGAMLDAPPSPEPSITKSDLGLAFVDSGRALGGCFEYSGQWLTPEAVSRMADHLVALLVAAAEDPDRPLRAISLVSDTERERLSVWGRGPVAPAPSGLVHELVSAQAENTPDATAVVAADGELSYRQLDRRADSIAHHLHELGAGPETVVAVCMRRCSDLPAALLGVWKAGAAYLPVDPDDSPERLGCLLADADARVLLTTRAARPPTVPQGTGVVLIDDLSWPPSSPPRVRVRPENAAYLIYTSGSTGTPKAVIVSHAGLANRLLWQVGAHGFGPADRILHKTPLIFDVSLWELCCALLAGATLVVAEPERHRDPAALSRLIIDNRVTVAHFVPSMLGRYVDEAPSAGPGAMRLIVASGEALPGPLARRCYERFGHRMRLHNLYGPTEASIDVTAEFCPPDIDHAPPIGVPVANTTAFVLDERLRPVPIGVPGELFIGGRQLARGYANRPALTAERFVAHPFDSDGARLYRTGDKARWRHDGRLEYLGRVDRQIKLRGHRIEPGEIEAALAGHPLTRAAAVVARSEDPAGPRLVAYAVPTDVLRPPTVEEVRDFLRTRLPDAMIPATFVWLPELPHTTSGKIDYSALPAPRTDRPALSAAFAEPASATEQVLAEIWREVLDVDRIGRHDDFFALGGHSLLATRVVARARDRLGIDLSIAMLFDDPTLTALASTIDAAPRTDAGPPITTVGHDGPLPLSFAQQRLWFLNQLEPEGTEYHVPLSLHLTGRLDLNLLRDALRAIVARQEVLRTEFTADEEGAPQQIIRAVPSIELPVSDLSGMPAARAQAEARWLVDGDAQRPFDLSAGSLLRARLVRLSEEDHVLALTVHHIAFDEWSANVLLTELSELYTALQEGRRPELPELAVQYADYAAWQREVYSGERLQEHLDYWRTQLADLPVLYLPTDRPRPDTRASATGKVDFTIDAEITQRLRRIGRRAGASMFMTLLAAYQALLARHSGQSDVIVGSPTANRGRPEVEDLIGPFINILPLRTDLSGDPAFQEVVARVRRVALDAYAHQDLPFEQLVEELQPDRDRRRHPLFQVIMNYAVAEGTAGRPSLADLSQCDFPTTPVSEKVDLRLALTEVGGELQGEMFYQASLFEQETIERLVHRFTTLLVAMSRNPDAAVSGLPLLCEDDLSEISGWAAGSGETPPRPGGVHEWISARVREAPHRPAVVTEHEALSYGDLESQANRLAHRLRAMGIGPESVVGLFLPQTADLVASVLAVLRAGGTYLALDPDAPLARLAFQLGDSAASVIITTDGLADKLPGHPNPPLILDDPDERMELERLATTPPDLAAAPAAGAYLVYTSGSTGQPKAVTVTRQNLATYVHHAVRALGLRPAANYAMAHSPAADFANTTLFGCLTQGGTLHLLDGEVLSDGVRLGERMRDHRVEFLKIVPTHLAALLATTDDPVQVLPEKALVLGGEATPRSLAVRLHEIADRNRITLHNHYGPTEATIGATTYRSLVPPITPTMPIGRPLPHTRVRVLDQHFQQVPRGVPGELFIGGLGLARGYRNRPALTAERFVADPFAADGSRLYRTGDEVRWLADGALEFLCRVDDQLKIRGHRIEPGEIEAALAAHPQIADGTVAACDDPGGGQRLAAYLVSADPERPPSAGEVRAHLAQRLPGPSIPSLFVHLARIPRTTAGKVDRRALPDANAATPAGTGGRRELRTLTEHMLADVWRDVLRIEQVGRDDDFFDLGGHSLLAANLVARLRAHHNVDLPLGAVFDAPRLADLAVVIDEQGERHRLRPPLIPMNHARSERAFFAVPPVSGSPFCYRQLGQSLAPELSFIGLQAPGVDDAQPPLHRVEDLAEHYVEALRSAQPTGPYFLGGWSVGAIVAFEMAQRLVSVGAEVGMLCLIAPARLRTRSAKRHADRVRSFIGEFRAGSPDAMDQAILAGWIRPLRCEPGFSEDPARVDRQLLLQRLEVIAATTEAKADYRARPFPGQVSILLPEEERHARGLVSQWRKVALGGVDVAAVPGSHQSLILDDANARAAAEWLKPTLIARGLLSLDTVHTG
ncbi:amino acid adenylation domain-containing protein [Actinomadura sp. 9N215]|uniref:amino acid adenylation domain-containing protein n=1 Tax=Actinomadura sp. 9N215 TaxID=3375150 RepID=UPI0037A41C77